MAPPSDWKRGKFLEWCTELPYINRPRISQTLSLKNTECYLQLIKVRGSKCYYMHLKIKAGPAKVTKPSFTIYMFYSNTYTRKEVTSIDPDGYIWCFYESYFPNQALDLNRGLFVRFVIVFENSIGPLLPPETKKDEKSTQADLMLSSQTDVEYLSLDFGELLQNGDHSDVQVLCYGGNIPAHRAILAARSKVFSDMFRDNTEESKSGLINMTTTEQSVMELCLEFIYKGKILNLPVEKASNLYVLGHALKISSLSKMCADLMIRNLCEDNYISYLVLSDKYSDDYLKNALIDYICERTELLKSEGWKFFSDEYRKTAIDVYRKYVVKYNM